MKRKWITRADLFVIFILLAAALSLYFFSKPSEAGDTVSVYVGNELCAEFSLADAPESYTVKTEKGCLVLSFEGGEAYALDADCPDHVCVRTGKIKRVGESIVCVPLGVCITVEGGTLDGVTG